MQHFLIIVYMLCTLCVSFPLFAGPNSDSGCAIDMNIWTDIIENSISDPQETEFWVAIKTWNVHNLAAFQIEFRYNATNLQFLGYLTEIPGYADKRQILLLNDGIAYGFCKEDQDSHVLNISYSLMNSDPDIAANGEGYLLFLKFKRINCEWITPLTIDNIYFIDIDNQVDHITDISNATIFCPSYSNIQGNVYYLNQPDIPLPDVTLSLYNNASPDPLTRTTNNQGTYSFTDIQKQINYKIFADKKNALYGLDPVDVSRVARCINNEYTLTNYEQNIADVDQDGHLSKTDYKMIAAEGINQKPMNSDWFFWAKNAGTTCFDGGCVNNNHYDFLLLEDLDNLHFFAARAGDVNHSWLSDNEQISGNLLRLLANASNNPGAIGLFDIDHNKRIGIPEAIFLLKNTIDHTTENQQQAFSMLQLLAGINRSLLPINSIKRKRTSCKIVKTSSMTYISEKIYELPVAIDYSQPIEGIALALSVSKELSLINVRLGNTLIDRYETFYHQYNNQIKIWIAATLEPVISDRIIAYLSFESVTDHCRSSLSMDSIECNNQDVAGGFWIDDQQYNCLDIGMGCSYIINAKAGISGAISPSGIITVPQFSSQRFEIRPEKNTQIDAVWVDDVFQGKISSYEFTNVVEDHSIYARFKPVSRLHMVKPVKDIDVLENSPEIKISLAKRFKVTYDNNNPVITKTILSNSSPELVSLTITNDILFISFCKNAYGEADITIQACCDGYSPVSNTFHIFVKSVNDPPEIDHILDQTFTMSEKSQIIPLKITDSDTPIQNLKIKAYSSNTDLVPNNRNNIIINGYDERTLQINPASGSFGKSIIHVIVSDGWSIANTSFQVTVEKQEYTMTTHCGLNGQCKQPLTLSILKGKDITYRFVPDDGYMVNQLIIDDKVYNGLNSYTFRSVSDHHSVSVTFKKSAHYSISTSTNQGGRIFPSGTVSVFENQNITFQIIPEPAYEISDVKIDNQSLGAIKTYSFDQIMSDHSISAEFKPVYPPIASFKFEYMTNSIPLMVHFQNTSLNMPIKQLWNFGDGHTSTLFSPKHVYSEPGNYTVTLYVENSGGKDHIEKKQCIIVNDKKVDFIIFPHTGTVPLTVEISDQSKGLTINQCDFGDGMKSDQLTHVYAHPGVYSITAFAMCDNREYTLVKHRQVIVDGRIISGRVVSKDNQAPVHQCMITLWHKSLERIQQTTTDINGYYTMSSLPPMDNLLISAIPMDQYNKQYYCNQQSINQASHLSTIHNDLEEINFSLVQISQYGITGMIKDNSGAGLSDVPVKAISYDHLSGGAATSDINGNYTITGLSSDTLYMVAAWSKKFQREFFYALSNDQLVPSGNDSVCQKEQAKWIYPGNPPINNVDIYMHEKFSIQGKVVDSTGNPLSNVPVRATSDLIKIRQYALSDSFGTYTITGLPALSESSQISYRVEVDCQDYPYQIYPMANIQNEGIEVTAGSAGIDFTLKTQFMISGFIKDTYSIPVPFAMIQIWSLNAPVQKQGLSYTDENGAYTINYLPPGNDYLLAVHSPHFPVFYFGDTSDKNQAEKIILKEFDKNQINVILSKGAAIKGYVFIENNGIQSPAPDGTLVKVWSNSTQSSGSCKTDQNGFYAITRLDYEIVDYRISAFHKDYMPAYYQSDQTTVYSIKDSGTVFPSSENRNMVLKKGLILKGNVSCDNFSVENVVVNVFSDEIGTSGNTISSKMPLGVNNYTITGLSPGTYTIQTFSEDYIDFITSTVLIDTDMQYDIILEQPHYSINGFIRNFNSIQNVTINIESASLQWRKEQDLIINNRNFFYTINKLKPASDYIISLISPAIPQIYYNSGQDSSISSPVDLIHGNVSDINFVFPDNIFDIRGHIVFPENAVSGDKVFVQAISDKSGIYLGTQVSFQGSNPVPYAIQGLIQSDDYLVSLLSEKYPAQYFSSVSTRAEAQSVSIMTASASGVDFTLNSGINVSGLVYLNGNPEFDIEITTQSNQWIKTTKTKLDGSFVLNGLPTNSNFILMAKKQNCPPVYYNDSGKIIRNIQKATHLWTGNENISDLQINIVDGDIIRGIVFNRQNLPLSNMQISAWSPIQGSGNSSFTDANGSFAISGLDTGMDYIVSVETGGSNYLPQQKENISSLSDSITFFLDQGYTISGIVKDEQNVPIEGIIVNIQSDMLSITKRQMTGKNGQYQIIGLPASYDYFIKTVSKKENYYSEYMADQIDIQSNQILDITLLSAYKINGYVFDKANQPIENVNIIVTSEWHNYQGKTITDNEGFYELMDIPDANDFIIRALHPLYFEQSIVNQHANNDIIIYLEEGNSIHGSIKDSNGLPISNASVRLHSQSVNIRKDALSNDLGKFQIDGLITRQNNNPIDYILDVYINNILIQTKPAIYVGDDVQFIIHFESLSGVIQDMSGVPVPEGLVPTVYIFEENSEMPFVLHADETGFFQVNQLSSDKKYKILIQAGNIAEWIGNDESGVQDMTNAHLFAPGETIAFRLSTSW